MQENSVLKQGLFPVLGQSQSLFKQLMAHLCRIISVLSITHYGSIQCVVAMQSDLMLLTSLDYDPGIRVLLYDRVLRKFLGIIELDSVPILDRLVEI